jgi:hypothetical protein
MTNTGPLDKIERDNWNAEANRRTKRWLIWTLLLLVVAYFLPLRPAVLLALFYARLADPDLKLENLPFAFPLPLLFRPPRQNTVYATSVVLKDESSGDTRARLHILDNGDPVLSLYNEAGDEEAVFTPGSDIHKNKTSEQLESETNNLERRFAALESSHRYLGETTVREVQSRIEQLERERERESEERNEKISSRSFELLDEEGKTRARLQISSDSQPYLAFYDGNGLSRASLSLNEGGYPVLQLTNLDWNRISSIGEDGSNRGRIRLGFDDDGYPELLMHDAEVGGLDPALVLAVRKAEWVGVGEVGVGDTRYRSKTAFLACDAWLGGKHEGKLFGARAVEPVTAESA